MQSRRLIVVTQRRPVAALAATPFTFSTSLPGAAAHVGMRLTNA